MNLKVEKNEASFELTIGADQFEEAVKKSFAKNGKKFSIPGFRKGKATRSVVEKYYGESVFYDDAIEIAFPAAYGIAVKELGIEPVATPEIDILKVSKEDGLVLSVKVIVKPEVVLGDYKNVQVEKVEHLITEDDVNAKVEALVKENARIVDVTDRAVKMGDTTIIDFAGYVDEVAFEGGTAQDYSLEIGSSTFIPGFEEQIVGAEIGQEIDVNVTFPENYGQAELAGKPAVFKVTVKEISEKQYPEVDDELAKDATEFDTLEEVKADFKAKLEAEAAIKANNEYEDAVIKAVVEVSTVEVPSVMVDQEVDVMLRDFDNQLRYQGLDLNTYLQYMNVTIDSIKDQYKTMAEQRVKSQLVLAKIAEVEAFIVTEEEIDAEMVRYAEAYNQSVEDFKKGISANGAMIMKDGIATRKAIDLITGKL